MMERRAKRDLKSPPHSFSSSSSSDFEFIISSLSPRKSSQNLCPADDLFYKGKLLPLHLSPRLSMVRTLFLASSSTSSSSDTTTTASRDSTGSSNSNDSSSSFTSDIVLLNEYCDSSRPSSVAEDDDLKRFKEQNNCLLPHHIKKPKYFSLARFSSVFKKENPNKNKDQENGMSGSSVKRAKEVIRKYVKKVKPLYEKLSQKQQQQQDSMPVKVKPDTCVKEKIDLPSTSHTKKDNSGMFSNSFSGNLRYPRRKGSVLSCPSSMRSSPNHSGVLCRTTVISGGNGTAGVARSVSSSSSSSMEELQNAIQGAIAHCKNSMVQNNKSLIWSISGSVMVRDFLEKSVFELVV